MTIKFRVCLLPALLILACGACSRTEPGPTAAATPIAATPTSMAARPTLAPEDLPTAAPIWTPTPESAVPPTVAAGNVITDSSVIALVNGEAISQKDYDSRLAQAEVHFVKQPGFDAKSHEGQQALLRLREQVLAWMIDQVLIGQAATELGIAVDEDQVAAEVAKMRGNDQARFDKWLAASGLTYDALRQQVRVDLTTAAIRDHVTARLSRDVFQVHVRHIWLSQRAVAEDVLGRLDRGDNFIVLARQFSEDQATREDGGDLGFMPRGVMPPAFEAAAFAQEPGQISDIVDSGCGFHIIQLVEIDPERPVPERLWPMVQQRAFEDWLAERRAASRIHRR